MPLFRLIWSFPRFLKSALILSASFTSTELFRDPPLLSTLRLTNLKIYYGAQQNLWVEFNTKFYSDSWTYNHQQKEESVGTKPLRNLDVSSSFPAKKTTRLHHTQVTIIMKALRFSAVSEAVEDLLKGMENLQTKSKSIHMIYWV